MKRIFLLFIISLALYACDNGKGSTKHYLESHNYRIEVQKTLANDVLSDTKKDSEIQILLEGLNMGKANASGVQTISVPTPLGATSREVYVYREQKRAGQLQANDFSRFLGYVDGYIQSDSILQSMFLGQQVDLSVPPWENQYLLNLAPRVKEHLEKTQYYNFLDATTKQVIQTLNDDFIERVLHTKKRVTYLEYGLAHIGIYWELKRSGYDSEIKISPRLTPDDKVNAFWLAYINWVLHGQ